MALSDNRHAALLEQVTLLGRISVADMAARLQVSQETIRRDLHALEQSGHVRCVYGGAVAQGRDAVQDRPMTDRMRLHRTEKLQVARHALSLVPQGATLFLDTGTTTLALAHALRSRPDLSVATNSLDIARLLGGAGLRQVSVTGGDVRGIDNALVGHETIAWVRGRLFDIAFMGIAAVDIEHGFMDYGIEESVLRQTLAAHARCCVLLAGHSKFGRSARLRTFGLGDAGTVVCDRQPPEAFSGHFARLGVKVLHGQSPD